MLFIKCFLFFISSLNTPPGTKVKLLGTVQIKNGLLLLDDSKISVLGGVVEHMVEKWELQRVSCHFCHSDSPTLIKTAKGTNGHLMIVLVYSHWLLSPAFLQSLAKHSRSNIGAEGGPPPFVPFGQVSAAQVWAALVCSHFDQTFFFFLPLCVLSVWWTKTRSSDWFSYDYFPFFINFIFARGRFWTDPLIISNIH